MHRSCRLALLQRSTWYAKSEARDQSALRQRIRDIALSRPRFGYLRVLVSSAEAAHYFSSFPMPAWRGGTQPHGILVTIQTPRFDALESPWHANGITAQRSNCGSWLTEPRCCGNVTKEFETAVT